MKKEIRTLLITLACIGPAAEATPWGLAGDVDVSMTDGVLSICIPATAKDNIAIDSLWVTESSRDHGPHDTMWDIELSPGSTPVTLRPGRCIKYGDTPSGYTINTPAKNLKTGSTYSARLNRHMNSPKRTDVLFYTSVFCPSIHNGNLVYLQYKYEEGKTIKPKCISN